MLCLVFFPFSSTLISFVQMSCMCFCIQANICIFLCLHPLTNLTVSNAVQWKQNCFKTDLLLFPGNEPPPLVLVILQFRWHFYVLSLFPLLIIFTLCPCPCPCLSPLCLRLFYLLLFVPFCCINLFSSSLSWILFHYFIQTPCRPKTHSCFPESLPICVFLCLLHKAAFLSSAT